MNYLIEHKDFYRSVYFITWGIMSNFCELSLSLLGFYWTNQSSPLAIRYCLQMIRMEITGKWCWMVTLRQDAVQLYMNSRYAPTPEVKATILVNFTTCSSPLQIEWYTSHHQNFVFVSLFYLSQFCILCTFMWGILLLWILLLDNLA